MNKYENNAHLVIFVSTLLFKLFFSTGTWIYPFKKLVNNLHKHKCRVK